MALDPKQPSTPTDPIHTPEPDPAPGNPSQFPTRHPGEIPAQDPNEVPDNKQLSARNFA